VLGFHLIHECILIYLNSSNYFAELKEEDMPMV